MDLKFHETATTKMLKLERVISTVKIRKEKLSSNLIYESEFVVETNDVDDEKSKTSGQILSSQKKKVIEFQE